MSNEKDNYDEFGFFGEIAEELGLKTTARPIVRRLQFEVSPDQTLSVLAWGVQDPEIVFLHGGGQNAHTWDAVALALGKPAVAFDLPGHGRSSWRADRDYMPWKNAEALALAFPRLAPNAKVVVGMSLGGATTIRLAGTYPQLVRRAVIVDVTPQVNDPSRQLSRSDRGTVALIGGPPMYDSLEAMCEAAIALSPHRSAQGVRRGVRHNAKKLDDGRWSWRYDLFGGPRPSSDFTELWDDVSRIKAPTLLVTGGESKFVTDEDIAEMKRRLPSLRTVKVPGAGHAVQSDRPLELARLIQDFVYS